MVVPSVLQKQCESCALNALHGKDMLCHQNLLSLFLSKESKCFAFPLCCSAKASYQKTGDSSAFAHKDIVPFDEP